MDPLMALCLFVYALPSLLIQKGSRWTLADLNTTVWCRTQDLAQHRWVGMLSHMSGTPGLR